MLITRTFKPYVVTYERTEGGSYTSQRLTVGLVGSKAKMIGPWRDASFPVTFETNDGRRFVGQAFTDRLPALFEIKPADGEVMTILD